MSIIAKLKKLGYMFVAGLAFFPVAVSAQLNVSSIKKPTGLPGDPSNTVGGAIGAYILLFLSIVGIIAVAYLIYGGFRYITSAGNAESAEQAKGIITNAIIGLVIIIFSYVIVVTIVNALANRNV